MNSQQPPSAFRQWSAILPSALAAFTLASTQAENSVMVFQAEDTEPPAPLYIRDTLEGFTGNGYVEGFTQKEGSLTFTVDVPTAGLHTLSIRYATPHGSKKTKLLVNGEPLGEIELQETDGFAMAPAGLILLKESENKITLENGWGWYAIDSIHLQPAPEPKPHEVDNQPVNPNASDETRALMAFLVDNFGKKMIAGQQEYPANNFVDTKLIHDITGKEPAIIGLDLMEQSPSRVERGSSSNVIDHAIAWHERGGIVSFTWHWNAPTNLIDSEDHRWWSGFYTNATTFNLANAIANPDSEDYQLLIRDIDAIAAELAKLQEKNIPVLWRPLHEAEGGWFWWGAKGPEPCKKLWLLMFDRMTNHHKLNNLIWVWNSVDPDWYPGDDTVDIVSFDSYPGANNYSPVSNQFQNLVKLSNNKKLIAMPENGAIPDPDLMAIYHVHWSWFCTWNGVIRDQNSDEHLRHVYNHPNVITLSVLPDLNSYKSNQE